MLKDTEGVGDVRQDIPFRTPEGEAPAPGDIRIMPGRGPGIPGVPPFRWVADQPFTRPIMNTVQGITPALAVKLDQGVGERRLVVLQNVGNNGLWYKVGDDAVARLVAVNNGGFLPGSPVAGAHLGGVLAIALADNVTVYGIADAPGNTDITVSEFGS